MTVWWIAGLAVFFTIVALWKPHFIWGLVSFSAWWFLFFYTRTFPLTGITVGDTGDTIFIGMVIGAACGILILTVIREGKEKKEELEKEEEKAREKGLNPAGVKETADDYYYRLEKGTKKRRA